MSVNLNQKEYCVLEVLSRFYESDENFLPFGAILSRAHMTDLDRPAVRRACRSLKRKGLAEFMSGLSNLDGMFVGSGYACTKEGWDWLLEHKL